MVYRDFRDMPVWQKRFRLLLVVYESTKKYPADERFGLISDTRRSANSIVHNIAEGFGRFEARDKTRFYKISCGSAYELMSQILVGCALGYLNNRTKEVQFPLCEEIIAELNAMIKTVERRG